MNKEECTVGQRVRITPKFPYSARFAGLLGTIKELPLGFVVVELDIALLAEEIEPVEAEKTDAVARSLK